MGSLGVTPWLLPSCLPGKFVITIHTKRLSYLVLERYAQLRRTLRPPHGPGLIGDIDTLIAATALVYDLTIVTTDSDYTRVPELQLMLLPRDLLKG